MGTLLCAAGPAEIESEELMEDAVGEVVKVRRAHSWGPDQTDDGRVAKRQMTYLKHVDVANKSHYI